MMGKRARQHEELKAQLEETGRPQWVGYVTEEAEILGTSLTRSGRIGTKQTKRMAKFTDRLALLQAIPFCTRTDFHVATRMLANSVASYGWVTAATLGDPAQHSFQQGRTLRDQSTRTIVTVMRVCDALPEGDDIRKLRLKDKLPMPMFVAAR